MIRVRKRDGSVEPFDAAKLAGAMYRAMEDEPAGWRDARDLAETIGIFLSRRRCRQVSSAAILEMAVKVLRKAGLDEAAATLEEFHALRVSLRSRVQLADADGVLQPWGTDWLVDLACDAWQMSRTVARHVVGEAETELLLTGEQRITRQAAIDQLNSTVLEFGLADAVPVNGHRIHA
jgi:hypothetical protein